MYEIQQQTQFQWEPVPEGEFETEDGARVAMKELEESLGWKNLRVVRQMTSDDGMVILGREVIFYGSDEGQDQSD